MSSVARIVIDTNLVLSALIFRGKVARLRLGWQNELFIPLVSKVTITELIRVLAYPKFKLTRDEQSDLLSDYLPFCETVKMPTKLAAIPQCRDPFDLPFLLLAVVSNADYLVTGDKDLLSIEDNLTCPIITLKDFIFKIDNS